MEPTLETGVIEVPNESLQLPPKALPRLGRQLSLGVRPMRNLKTKRLTLEPLLESHAPAMFEVLSDPAIYEFENEPPS